MLLLSPLVADTSRISCKLHHELTLMCLKPSVFQVPLSGVVCCPCSLMLGIHDFWCFQKPYFWTFCNVGLSFLHLGEPCFCTLCATAYGNHVTFYMLFLATS